MTKGDEVRMFSSLKRLHVEERVDLFYEIKLKPMEMRIRRSFFVFVFVSFVFIKYCQTFSHSRALAWRVPWTEEPGRLQSMGSLRVGHD